MLDDRFGTMGTVARVVRDADGGLDVPALFAEIEQRLSRFDPGSDLSRLNADPRACAPAGPLLRAAVAGALRAASLTGGLVDPTLLGALRRAGYGESRAHVQSSSLARALACAPPRRPARPDPAAGWRAVEVDDAAGVIRRPPGLELDLGGSVKGWAATLSRPARAPRALRRRLRRRPARERRERRAVGVHVRHPLTGAIAHTLRVRSGGVATSGIDARLWERPKATSPTT